MPQLENPVSLLVHAETTAQHRLLAVTQDACETQMNSVGLELRL